MTNCRKRLEEAMSSRTFQPAFPPRSDSKPGEKALRVGWRDCVSGRRQTAIAHCSPVVTVDLGSPRKQAPVYLSNGQHHSVGTAQPLQ